MSSETKSSSPPAAIATAANNALITTTRGSSSLFNGGLGLGEKSHPLALLPLPVAFLNLMTLRSPSTLLALCVPTSFSLVSLAYTYHDRIGLHRDVYSFGHFFATHHLIYRAPTFRLISPLTSLVQHLHHHVDISHFAAAVGGLWSAGLSAQLGFVPTLVVFYGGGAVGALVDVYEKCVINNNVFVVMGRLFQGLWNSEWTWNSVTAPALREDDVAGISGWLGSMVGRAAGGGLDLGSTVWSLCGGDAGVVALLGAGACQTLWLVNSSEEEDEDEDEEDEIDRYFRRLDQRLTRLAGGDRYHSSDQDSANRFMRKVYWNVQVIATLLTTAGALWDPTGSPAGGLPEIRRRVFGVESTVGLYGKAAAFVFGFGITHWILSSRKKSKKGRKKARRS